MKHIYEKPEVERITLASESDLMLTAFDLTPSNVEGGFTDRT